jgi:iron complex outermembrane receptor protein
MARFERFLMIRNPGVHMTTVKLKPADLRRGLAMACALLMPIGTVWGQADEIEEIIVTGSRITRDPGNYVGPMTVVDEKLLEEIPSYSLKDALDQLPAMGFQATGKNNSNGGRGAEFTEIHQLEPERTLVLLNGRRMVSTIRDTLGLAVDMQSFPINMIQNVEVLQDGASAVYGSDAIAGVVNIITKKDFEGFEFTAGAGNPDEDGGDTYNLGALWGQTGERGFFSAGVTWKTTDMIDYQERDWSKDPLLGQLDGGGGLVLNLFGSGIPPAGRQPDAGIIFIRDPVNGTSYQNYDTFCLGSDNGGPSPGTFTGPLDGSIECLKNMGHRYNYNLIRGGNSLINDTTVINFLANGEYRFDNGATGYVEGLITHRDNKLLFTPLPVADAHGKWQDMTPVPATNPWVPADALAVIQAAQCTDPVTGNPIPGCVPPPTFQMYWRGLDAGNRVFDVDSDTYKATGGFRGDLQLLEGRDWDWDTWFTMGRSDLSETTDNQIHATHLRIAMDPAQCNFDPSCPKVTPDNLAAAQAENPNVQVGDPLVSIFGRNNFTQEEKDYILYDDTDQTEYELYHLGATLAGDLLDMPAGELGFATGLEWRKESGETQPSGVVQLGDSGGNFSEPTKGDYRAIEAYAEFNVPLVRDVTMIHLLDLDAAVRWSDYDTFGSETTYKLALSWGPIETLRFRGVVSTGFRAPNVLELFGGLSDNYQLVGDPCNNWDAPGTDPVLAANCQAQGVPPGFVQNASQLRVSEGGNPDLDAEESDNWSAGLVWQPVENFRFALDYYNVEVDQAVGTPNPTDVINACYATPNLAAPECARFERNLSGNIVTFLLLNENLATAETSGVDWNSTYTLDTGFGQLQFDWLGNWLNEYKETTETGIVDDRTDLVAGVIADYTGYPEWRSNFSVTLSRDNWSAGLTYRYIDGMDIFDALDFDDINLEASSMNYFDVNATYQIGAWELGAGIENFTDDDPPYVPDTSANTSAIYDWVGRMYYVRAGVSFQ